MPKQTSITHTPIILNIAKKHKELNYVYLAHVFLKTYILINILYYLICFFFCFFFRDLHFIWILINNKIFIQLVPTVPKYKLKKIKELYFCTTTITAHRIHL